MLLVLVDLIPNCVKLYFLKFCNISSHHTEEEEEEEEDYESIEDQSMLISRCQDSIAVS